MKNLLRKLNNPQLEHETIHFVGTNGKGSTLTFLKNMLMGQGYQIGTFTSPFIIKFNERISFNGMPISDTELTKITEQLYPIIQNIDQKEPELSPSEFEIITAIMFVFFKNKSVDYLLIEAGIGGRYDSTNVINSILTVVTNVGLDHTKLLGDTVEKIAKNKADVISKNSKVVVGDVSDSVYDVILETVKSRKADVVRYGQDYQIKRIDHSKYQLADQQLILNANKMEMNNQIEILNATVAIESLKFILKDKLIDKDRVIESIYKTTWPGRYEKINDYPQIYIDGAHNVPAIKELSNMISKDQFGSKVMVILAIFRDKDYVEMIKELINNKKVELILTNFDVNENRPTADLYYYAKKFNLEFYPNWVDAFEAKKEQTILFTGSLLFISEVRKRIGNFKN